MLQWQVAYNYLVAHCKSHAVNLSMYIFWAWLNSVDTLRHKNATKKCNLFNHIFLKLIINGTTKTYFRKIFSLLYRIFFWLFHLLNPVLNYSLHYWNSKGLASWWSHAIMTSSIEKRRSIIIWSSNNLPCWIRHRFVNYKKNASSPPKHEAANCMENSSQSYAGV